jgi:hypothetical protein
MGRSHSISSGLALMGMDERAVATDVVTTTGGEVYGISMPWTPPTDPTGVPYTESPLAGPMPTHSRSHSYDLSMSASTSMAWPDPTVVADMYAYQMPTPASLGSNYFPSPSATPNLRPSPSRNKTTGAIPNCTCFTVCLQSLQALHNASAPASPPFDIVLSLNRKAVEGCAAMLACGRCMARSGTHTAAMLLATVIGKITSFYKNASTSHFVDAPGLGVSLGAYQIQGEDGRWLELEILARELRKLEEVYARFTEVCGELSEDPDVSRAMIGYLGNTLGSTMEVVSRGKGGMGFA